MTANRVRAAWRARGGAGAGQDHADEMMAQDDGPGDCGEGEANIVARLPWWERLLLWLMGVGR